jgi:2-amino-4-hydroxy-6-hydroxymethyldihydropteridine diphosphokinase
MHKCHLLLGSNLGDRIWKINNALNLIELQIGKISAVSAFYETEPWGFTSSEQFLNKAVIVETHHSPHEALILIHQIEKNMGRKRLTGSDYASREIDIDILFFDDEIVNTETLVIPHPQLQNRKFALIPLAEIAAETIHPVIKKSVCQLLEECPDQLMVNKYNEVQTKNPSQLYESQQIQLHLD